MVSSIAIILVIAIIVILVLPEARIQISLRTEIITRDLEIRVEKSQTEVDKAGLIIPGKVIEQELSGSQKYSATGVKNIGHKASGFVSIYNFSKTTLILKAQTTTLSVGGKKYYFTQDVGNIRPTAFIGLEDQEVDETSLIPPVPVAAAEPGVEYNLPVGTRLEIDNEVFGHQPETLYAVAAESLTGGTTEHLKVVTASDIASGYSNLEKELIQKARDQLKEQSEQLRLLDSAIAADILEQKTDPVVNTVADTFTTFVNIRLRALVYDESDVKTAMIDRIERLLPENKVFKDDSHTRLASSFLQVNLEEGNGVLKNHFEGKISYLVDREEMMNKIKGRTAPEIREILLSRPEIANVETKFYPFWVKRAPKFTNRILLGILEL